MYYAFLIILFLEAVAGFYFLGQNARITEKLVQRFDARERELLDRLMYATKTPWNLPERPAEQETEEAPKDLNWREY